ncbi:hypothetical protein HIM_05403 [Hirsutella minnesotensis 3608]|uniref:Autophagy-related protein 29 n=1 Tax=Hirsutella minnesotensis 3608 TaxID=1043627 RepID=A0A0F8A5E9_9HYPO|nr:hypothetical protein HIM_05403 [Hirsutella minnesotensis 3608]
MAEPTYTVLVRIPVPRGDFVDPPPVHWDSTKDEALWKILSGAAQTNIDCKALTSHRAERFDVPVDFLLQQVAYLTERHASQVRAQVRKATAAARGSAAPSPVPGSDHPRTTSALSTRRDSPMPRHDSGSVVTTPLAGSGRPGGSRNTSTNTGNQRDAGGSSGRLPISGGRTRLSSLPAASSTPKSPEATPRNERGRPTSPGSTESTSAASSDDDDDGSSPAQSRIIRRPPRFQQQEVAQAYQDDEEDEESEPAFQPYQSTADQASAHDLGSTLKGDGRPTGPRGKHIFHKDTTLQSQTSDSSASSAAVLSRPGKPRDDRKGIPSPRRMSELAGRSPVGKGRALSREGSEGTPSMGSSFSDLDDASVTQSALEEALASHMNRGAISSRFSISQAFRSRYMPGSNQ